MYLTGLLVVSTDHYPEFGDEEIERRAKVVLILRAGDQADHRSATRWSGVTWNWQSSETLKTCHRGLGRRWCL